MVMVMVMVRVRVRGWKIKDFRVILT